MESGGVLPDRKHLTYSRVYLKRKLERASAGRQTVAPFLFGPTDRGREDVQDQIRGFRKVR